MPPRRRLPVVARRRVRATVANPYLRANRALYRPMNRRPAYPRRVYTRGRRYTQTGPRRYVTYG